MASPKTLKLREEDEELMKLSEKSVLKLGKPNRIKELKRKAKRRDCGNSKGRPNRFKNSGLRKTWDINHGLYEGDE